MGSHSEPLSQLEVLAVDCQATAAAPRGHLLEIGWARVRTTHTHARAFLITLPDGQHIPPAVARITGISERMMRDGVDGHVAWRELSDHAATLTDQPAPTVIHFAQFEQPFLRALAAGPLPLCAVHHELSRQDLGPHDRWLRLGTRLWREGRRDRDIDEDDPNEAGRGLTAWTPEFVQVSLEWLALRAALARRRAIWLTRLFDSSVAWREHGVSCARLIVIENGEIVSSTAVEADAPPPIPPGYRRPVAARREVFTLASFDRLRVLTTELKRLIAAGAPVALRLGVGPALDESRLASALWWV